MESVLIVEDHSMIRLGLTQIVSSLEWTVAMEAQTLSAARNSWRTLGWSLAILDVNLPDGDGLELLSEIRGTGNKNPILIHTFVPETALTRRALKLGADGVLNKSAHPDEIKGALQKVSQGGKYISSSYAEQLAAELAGIEAPASHEKLSSREYMVMSLYAQGYSNPQVAEKLGCNVNTISTYRARIQQKLNLKSRTDIVRYALKNRLVML